MDPVLQTILAAIASFFAITIIFSFIYVLCLTTRRNRHHPQSRHRTRPTRSAPNLATSSSFVSVVESQLFDSSLNQMEMSNLVKGTRNFSSELIVDDGSFGLVGYSGPVVGELREIVQDPD